MNSPDSPISSESGLSSEEGSLSPEISSDPESESAGDDEDCQVSEISSESENDLSNDAGFLTPESFTVPKSDSERKVNQMEPLPLCTRRLLKEFEEMSTDPPPLCGAKVIDDNLMKWEAWICGPPNSVYEGGIFRLSLNFGKEYPFQSPKVKFLTKIYHCNIDRASGEICLDILDKNWSPVLRVSSLLLSICSLLTDCNPNNPIENTIAWLYKSNREQHDKKAREYTAKYAGT